VLVPAGAVKSCAIQPSGRPGQLAVLMWAPQLPLWAAAFSTVTAVLARQAPRVPVSNVPLTGPPAVGPTAQTKVAEGFR
jgi:hypothetical protein